MILDLCGGTGSWSKPYRNRSVEVKVITLPDYDVTKWREYPDLVEIVYSGKVSGVLAAPPCTKFSRAAWQIPRKDRDFIEGMRCVRACLDIIWEIQEHNGANLQFWALENPDGYLTRFLGYPPYSFQPWQFGETDFRATKRTMLWGYFQEPKKTVRKRNYELVPKVLPHSRHDGRGGSKHGGHAAWAKKTQEERSATSPHFAEAFYQANLVNTHPN